MTLRDLRSLLESPFRNYANFSGRAGRAEFWLFILTFVVLTNLASVIGYGGMKLAGYQSHHHEYETLNHIHAPEDDTETSGLGLPHMVHEGHDSTVIFKFHRHAPEEGYHLHAASTLNIFLTSVNGVAMAKVVPAKALQRERPGCAAISHSNMRIV